MIEVAAYEVDGSSVLLSTDLTANAGGSTSATFVGSIDKAVGEQKIPAGKTYDYVAAYPADKVTINGKTVSFTVENAYTVTPNQLNGHLFDFMVAKADDCASIAVTEPAIAEHPAFEFNHVLGFFEISLAADKPIRKVKVEAPSGVNIAGEIEVSNFSSLAIDKITNGSNVIELTIANSGTATEGNVLYVPFIPCSIDGDIKVTLTAADENTHEIVKKVNREFEGGKVVRIGKVGFHEVEMSSVQTYVQKGNAGSFHKNTNGAKIVATTNFEGADNVKFYAGNQDKTNAVELKGTGYTQTQNGRTYTLDVDLSNSTYEGYVWAVATINGKEHSTEAVYVLIPGPVSVVASAKTTYSIAKNESVAAANTADMVANRLTIFDPKATVNIANADWVSNLTLTQSGTASDSKSGQKVTSVTFGNKTSQALGSYTYNASATVGERTFEAAAVTVYVTGLPLHTTRMGDEVSTSTDDAKWYANDDVTGSFDNNSDHIKTALWSFYCVSPRFYIPSQLNVVVSCEFSATNTAAINPKLYAGAVSSQNGGEKNTVYNSYTGAKKQWKTLGTLTLTSTECYVSLSESHKLNQYNIYQTKIEYE